jgi:hypothetical protein
MSESQQSVTGPGAGLPAAPTASGFQLQTLGPAPGASPMTHPTLGYAYRDNETFTENFDKIEVIVDHLVFGLAGYHTILNNGSTTLVGSAYEDVANNFWPNVYTFLWEMAQKRDGYKATDYALNTAANLRYRDNLLIMMKINIRVLAQLFCGGLVNEGMKSTLSGFRTYRSRIIRDLEASNRLIYPQAWDDIINYWSQVYALYPGGPIVAHLFYFGTYLKAGGQLAPATGTMTAWAALPDLTSSTDVGYLLSDIELAQSVLERYNLNVANTASDLRNVNSIYAMMGFPTPQTPLPIIKVDPDKFHAQYMRYGILFSDTKGVGADTHLYWPDARGSNETLINIDFSTFTPDILDYIGAKGRTGVFYDADDDDTPGYTAEANDLTSYGLVTGSDFLDATQYPTVPPTKIYTREDGWATLARELDYTAAAGVQAHIWSIPDMLVHPEAWRLIM